MKEKEEEKEEDKKIIAEARKVILDIKEDKELLTALLTGNFENDEVKAKHKAMLDLINRMEKY